MTKTPVLLLALPLILLAGSCASSPETSLSHDTIPVGTRVDLGLSLADAAGARHDLGAVGGPKVLAFWQTWCQPCLREAPRLASAAQRNPSFAFYGVVSGNERFVDAAEVREVSDRLGLPYPSLLDRELALTGRCGVTGTPTILVVDEAGVIRYRGHSLPEDLSPYSP